MKFLRLKSGSRAALLAALVLLLCMSVMQTPRRSTHAVWMVSDPEYFMRTPHRIAARVNSVSLRLLGKDVTSKERHQRAGTPPSRDLISALLRVSKLSLKLQVAQLAASEAAVNALEPSSEPLEIQPRRDEPTRLISRGAVDCVDTPTLHDELPPLTTVQDSASRRRCAFVTYVRRDADAQNAALVLFSVRSHQSVCDSIFLITDAVSNTNRQRLAHLATLVDMDALPHGHDPHGFDLLRLWQLTTFEKVVFLPTTVLALRNLTSLTELPEWSVSLGEPSNRHDVPVMTLVPSDSTFAEMRRIQERTARTATVMQFLTDFFSRQKYALQRRTSSRRGQFRFTHSTKNAPPVSYVVPLRVGSLIHQRDFAVFAANGTDIFENRPLLIQYPKTKVGATLKSRKSQTYEGALCGWKTRTEFRYDSNFVRYVYDALMRRALTRSMGKTFTFFEENGAPVKLMLSESTFPDPHEFSRHFKEDSADHAATATLRPTFHFAGSHNFTAIFPSDAEMRGMTVQQRSDASKVRSRFLAALASDIEAWQSIDPGLVLITDVDITPDGELSVSCEIRLEVESTHLSPDKLRSAISNRRDDRWMSRVIAVYRQATRSHDDARVYYKGVQWDRPDPSFAP